MSTTIGPPSSLVVPNANWAPPGGGGPTVRRLTVAALPRRKQIRLWFFADRLQTHHMMITCNCDCCGISFVDEDSARFTPTWGDMKAGITMTNASGNTVLISASTYYHLLRNTKYSPAVTHQKGDWSGQEGLSGVGRFACAPHSILSFENLREI